MSTAAALVPAFPALAIDDFAGYTPATNDLFTTWNNSGGAVVRNTNASFIGLGLDWSGIGYGVGAEVLSRAYLSPIHVASAQHTSSFVTPFFAAPAAGGTPITLSGGSTTALGLGYDLSIGAMTGAHIAPDSGVTSYAILDLANSSDYVGRSVFEVGHGDSNPGLSPRIAATTINSASSTTFTVHRPPAPLQGGDSGGPTMTRWTNPLGQQELTFLGTHYGTDFSGNTYNYSNFFASTTSINAANNAMIAQGFAVRLAGVAATAWTGDSSGNFATAGNWSSGTPGGANYVAFNGGAVTQRNVDFGASARAMRGMQFGAGAAGEGFTFSNGTLQLGRGGIANYSSATQTFAGSLDVTLTDHQYWDARNAGLQVNGAVNLNGKLLVVQGGHNTTIAGVVSDSAGTSIGLTKYGTGTLTLTQPATYAGKTWIYGGTLAFSGSGALPASPTLVIANNETARLELGGRSITTPSLSSVAGPSGQYGTIDLGTGGTLTVDQASEDRTYSGRIAGGTNGQTALTLRGPTTTNHEFVLAGPSTFAGQTRIERGAVYINHASALGASGAGNETIIAYDDTTKPSVRMAATGTTNETIVLLNTSTTAGSTNTATLSLTAPTATVAGPIVLARNADNATRATAFTLSSVNSTALVTDTHIGPVTGRLESGAVAGSTSLNFQHYQNSTFHLDGVISNGTLGTALAVNHNGLGTIHINAANTYTGATNVRADTVVVGVDALPGQAGAFGNATSAVTVGSQNVSFETGMYAADGVTIGRNLTISATNTGGVQIGALDNTAASYTGTVTLSRDNTSLYAGANSLVTFTNNILNNAVAPQITKQGAGTIALSGANTYVGGTTVEAGRLRALSSGALGTTGTVQVTGGVLEVGSGVTLANTNLQLAGGQIEVNGTAAGLAVTNGTLSGTGTVAASLALNATDDVLSPGSGTAPGTLNIAGTQTWAGLTYDWAVNDLDIAASPTSADRLSITGPLALGGAYTLNIQSLTLANTPGNASGYDGGSRLWTVLTADGGITGFDPLQWTLDTSAFTLAGGQTGTFALSQQGNDLVLSFTTVPEPSKLAIAGFGAALTLGRRRRARSPRGI